MSDVLASSARASSPYPLRGAAFQGVPPADPSPGQSRSGSAALIPGRGAQTSRRRPRRMSWVVGAAVWSLAVLLLWAPAASAREACPNEASREGPSAALPECRVYEQVTPVNKGDALDLFSTGPDGEGNTFEVEPSPNNWAYVAENGEALLLEAGTSLAPEAPTTKSAYVFSREVGGWQMNVVAPPLERVQDVEAQAWDPLDLSKVGFSDVAGSYEDVFGGDPSALQGLEGVGPVGGPYATPFSASGVEGLEGRPEIVGASTDVSKVILEGTNHRLAAGAEGQDEGSRTLYESAGAGECTQESSNCNVVNIDPQGKLMVCGAVLGEGTQYQGGTYSAVSSNGSKVFFTAPDPHHGESGAPGCWSGPERYGHVPEENAPQVYARINGERTVEVSAPEAGVAVGTPENPLHPAIFAGASADGSKVFFIDQTELTKDDTGHAPELYEYETETGKLTRISRGESGGEGDVNFVAGVSQDGSAVYFTAWKALAPGATPYEEYEERKGVGGPLNQVNVYRYDTVTGKTTYITHVGKEDFPPSHKGVGGPWSGLGPAHSEFPALNAGAEWYASGNGQYLVFGEQQPITGFNDTKEQGVTCVLPFAAGGGSEPSEGVEAGPHTDCYELYRYSASAAEHKEPSIVCVSCFGGAPVGDAWFDRTIPAASTIPPVRPISEDGKTSSSTMPTRSCPMRRPARCTCTSGTTGDLDDLIADRSGNALFLGLERRRQQRLLLHARPARAAPTPTSPTTSTTRASTAASLGLTPTQCTGTGCQGVPARAADLRDARERHLRRRRQLRARHPGRRAAPRQTPSKPKQLQAWVRQEARQVRQEERKKAKRWRRGGSEHGKEKRTPARRRAWFRRCSRSWRPRVASGAPQSPQWTVTAYSRPDQFPPRRHGHLQGAGAEHRRAPATAAPSQSTTCCRPA